MTGDWLASIAAAIIVVASAVWIALVRRVAVPERRGLFVGAYLLAMALGVLALVFPVTLGGRLAAWSAVLVGGVFVSLRVQSAQPPSEPTVTLGEPIPAFTALDDSGAFFEASSLRGRPYLLKFFRGHWCPYCMAELRRWNELQEELDLRNVAVVTVSAETPEAIARGRRRHGLPAIMLADPECTLISRYHLCNEHALGPRGWGPQAIPTTILVDAAGIVRWIDQAADHQVRSDPERVLAALREHLDGAPAPPAQS